MEERMMDNQKEGEREVSFRDYVELFSAKRIVEKRYSGKFLDVLATSFSVTAKEMLDVCGGRSIYDFGLPHPGIVKRVARNVDAEYFIVKHAHNLKLDYEVSDEFSGGIPDAVSNVSDEFPENVHFIDESEISDVRGVIISNKLFSILPFHIVVRDGEIKEVYVKFDGGRFSEILRDLRGERAKEIEEYVGRVEDPRNRIEVCIEAVRMLKEMGERLSSGFIITSDFLLDPSEFAEGDRASGAIACHSETIHTHNPFFSPGKLVIRTAINLSALVEFGSDVGLHISGLTNHVHLLRSTIGQVDEFSPEIERISAKRDSRLGSVRILIQHKGLRNPILKSLRFVPRFDFWERYNLPSEEEELLPEG